jgi:hypothetical protein
MGRLGLAGSDTTPPDVLLYRLRRLFPSLPFPSFSLALEEYSRHFHPEQVYGSNRMELLQGACDQASESSPELPQISPRCRKGAGTQDSKRSFWNCMPQRAPVGAERTWQSSKHMFQRMHLKCV